MPGLRTFLERLERVRRYTLLGRRAGVLFLTIVFVMTASIVTAQLVFSQTFPGWNGGGPAPQLSVLTKNCVTLSSSGFPTTAPAAGAILFTCSGGAAVKVERTGSSTPTIAPSSIDKGPPSPYTVLTLNLHKDPPLLPCIPSDRIIKSGSSVTFTASDVGHSFDYCAAFSVATSATFPSFTVTWSQS